MRRAFLACGLAAAMWVLARDARAGDSTVIQDFEKTFSVGTWPEGARYEFSTEWAKDGRQSLKIFKGAMVAISDMTTHDWSAWQVWRFYVRVPGNEGVNIGLELADDVNGYNNRHQNSTSAPPGDSVVDIDIGGNLWRGERNKPDREDKSPIHKDRISRFSLTAQGADVFVDRIELVKIQKLEGEGCFALDLGRSGQTVQSQWTGIDPDTRWDEAKGCGMTPGAAALRESTPYPTLVMGDGIRMHDAALEVRLKGGKHLGWAIFERSGFWEGQQAVYTKATLLANGQAVHSHEARLDDAWFLLQDVEAITQDDVVNRMVMPRQLAADFTFDAAAGKNSFKLAVEGDRGMPARLAGLVLAPDTAEGRAFMEAHKKLQLDAVAKAHNVLRKERREGDPAKAAEPLVVLPLPTDHAMYPRDWPAETRSRPVPPLRGFAGMTVHRLLGLYAARDMEIEPSLAAQKAAGPAARFSVGNYMPTHDYEVTAVHIEVHDYRPMKKFRAGPELARALLVSIDIPAGTAPGKYSWQLALSCAGGAAYTAKVPVELEVLPGELPPLDWPAGLFFSGVPAPRGLISDADYWRLSEDLFRLLQAGSKTMLTSGPGYTLSPQGVQGDDAVRYLKLAAKHGLDRKVVNYGGFDLSGDLTSPAVFAAWEAFRKQNGLPEHYLNTFDEPGIPADFPPVEARLRALKAAGFPTIGWTSMADPAKADENHRMLVRESHSAAFNLHSPETLKWAASLGNEPWVYNNGLSRYDQGVHLWRNRRSGAQGRVDWIASIVQGFQFDAMDGREPDLSCFYFHRELGVLPAPRYLGVCEGGFDARLLSELERRAKANPSAAWARKIEDLFREVESKPYRQAMPWEELEKLRDRTIALMAESRL